MSDPILLVDDDPDDVDLFCIAAREAKVTYPIQIARNGEEALDLLLNQRLSPVLTILDIKMPGIDGLEVLRRLRTDPIYHNVVIVILTGSDLEKDRIEAAKLGCNLFFTKPASMRGYLEIVSQIKSLLAALTPR